MGLPAVPHPCVNWSLGLLRRLGSFHEYEILIGADVPAALISNEVRKGGDGLPYPSKTPLGWTLVGVYEGTTSNSNVLSVSHICPKECENSL